MIGESCWKTIVGQSWKIMKTRNAGLPIKGGITTINIITEYMSCIPRELLQSYKTTEYTEYTENAEK